MKSTLTKLNQIIVNEKFPNSLFAVCFALASALIIKAKVIPVLLIGKGFEIDNPILRVLLFLFYFIVFILVYFFIQWLYKKLMVITKPIWRKLDSNEQKREPHKTFILALVTITLGVLSIFIITNITARIDTKYWRLNGLNIIPTIEPIGNDFQVGFYEPATYLWNSGFKSISADGTYQSIYPPFANVFGLLFILFDAQTAYLIIVAILILCNLACLIIATLMIKELFLEKVIKEKLVTTILSIFLFAVISFFNFSSYTFLFSIERGNVDAIAMFFAMLSLWILFRQPKKIWLQVILLTIATHLKIYPAVLFLVLFYFHGRKLIVPMLAINLALLFVSGPKLAWNFLQSVTAGGGGAGVGNSWSWVGNHSAYSFASMLTQRYSRFEKSFFDLWIACLLIPIAFWIQACFRIIRNKYSELNSVLLIMVTIPLMVLVPTISHDYRLVILSISFLFFIGYILYQILQKPGWEKIVELVLTLGIMFLISRPYDMAPDFMYVLKVTSSFFINNKFVWAVALEGIMTWNILRNFKNDPVTQ